MASAPHCIAVLRFSSLGDIVLAEPAVHALAIAWPQSRIIFVTHAQFAPLVQFNPWIHEVIALPRSTPVASLRRRLVAARVDAVLDLHGKARGALLRYGLPGARRAVWQKRPWQQTLAVRLGGARYRARMHIAARYHQAVERLVGRPLARLPLHYHLTEAQRAIGAQRLVAAGLDAARPLVGMAPGAMWGTKRWAPERFAELARRTLGEGAQVVLTGSAAEAALCQRVAASAPGAVNLAGQLDLPALSAVIAACTAWVANDSGPMHMARALGVPTLAFFGSTDPGQFDFTGHALLFAGVDCSPCSFHGLAQCPRGHLRCLNDLEVEPAQRALGTLLARGPVAPVMG